MVNLFSADLFRLQYESALPPEADTAEGARALAQFDATIGERYVAFNRWLMDTLADAPAISGFVAMDPWVLPPERNVEHLREMAEQSGARGVKLHPVVQKFEVNDPRMHPVYQACIEMGLTVLSHTGPARGREPFAEVPAFAPMLREFPGLSVVLAHLGGGEMARHARHRSDVPQRRIRPERDHRMDRCAERANRPAAGHACPRDRAGAHSAGVGLPVV